MEKLTNIILVDGISRDDLLPLTFTRPVAALRVGITTIKEKWELLSGASCSYETLDYLREKFPSQIGKDKLYIDGAIIPDEGLLEALMTLGKDEILMANDEVIARRSGESISREDFLKQNLRVKNYGREYHSLRNSWDIFTLNDSVLRDDFKRITKGRKSQPISDTNKVIGGEYIFIEEGAKVECAILNASAGPVYIGKNTEIMEGSVVRGPFALCEHASLKMGAKIYGATTIGPYCKVGGEIHNSVFIAYSSKPHDGFLGNAVIGEWCNLSADTNNSNLKNNYDKVKLWNYTKERFVQTGLQFCGLIMGDHSKCAINTMFNTGTIIGVSANIYGAGFPRNFIPSFSWGGPGGLIEYKIEKAFETAAIAMTRRGLVLNETEQKILKNIFIETGKYRNF